MSTYFDHVLFGSNIYISAEFIQPGPFAMSGLRDEIKRLPKDITVYIDSEVLRRFPDIGIYLEDDEFYKQMSIDIKKEIMSEIFNKKGQSNESI